MTTEEKLQHFLEFCMEDARSRSAKMLDEYTAALEQTFSEHQEDAKRRANSRWHQKANRSNGRLTNDSPLEQIGTKREFGKNKMS